MTTPNPTNSYSQNYQGNAVRQPSEIQITRYYEICLRKKIQPKDVTQMNMREMSKELERIYAMPTPASDAQCKALREMLQEMVEIGITGVRMPSESFFDKLTMDTASKWIEDAKKIRAQNFDKIPATEQQIDRISKWYACPDIEWENISTGATTKVDVEIQVKITELEDEIEITDVENNVTKYILKEEATPELLNAIKTGKLVLKETRSMTTNLVINRRVELEHDEDGVITRWRAMTPEEFRDELKSKLTHSIASALLDRYSGQFSAYLKTLATNGQKTQIRNLENKLATIWTPKEVTVYSLDEPFTDADTFESEIDSTSDTPFNTARSKKVDNWNPNAYTPLEEVQLGLLTRDGADKYIQQLRYELHAKENLDIHGAQELSGDFEDMRTAKNIATANTKEFTELNNMLYALADASGTPFELSYDDKEAGTILTVDSLRHDAMQVFFQKGAHGASDEAKQEVRAQIIDFMKEALIRDAVTFKALMKMCDKSETATEILDNLLDDAEFARFLMKKQLNDK